MGIIDRIIFRLSNWFLHRRRLRELEILKYRHKVLFGKNVRLGNNWNIEMETENCKLEIGDDFYTRLGCIIRVGEQGVLHIGKNVFFNNYCTVTCLHSIEIGDNVMFGEGVKVYDHDHLILKENYLRISREHFNYGKVVIGKNSWLGSNVIILRGVTIGENVVIGANSVIYKNIPANSIVKTAAGLDITTSTLSN